MDFTTEATFLCITKAWIQEQLRGPYAPASLPNVTFTFTSKHDFDLLRQKLLIIQNIIPDLEAKGYKCRLLSVNQYDYLDLIVTASNVPDVHHAEDSESSDTSDDISDTSDDSDSSNESDISDENAKSSDEDTFESKTAGLINDYREEDDIDLNDSTDAQTDAQDESDTAISDNHELKSQYLHRSIPRTMSQFKQHAECDCKLVPRKRALLF